MAVAPAMADDFSGFYIGGNIGTSTATSNATTTTVTSPAGYFTATSIPAINSAGAQDFAPGGGNAGGQIGYNWQSGHTVFGVVGDYSSANIHGYNSTTAAYPCCPGTGFTVRQSIDVTSIMTARAKLGLTAGHTLFFVTGGWARANAKYAATFADTFAPATESASSTQTLKGWTYGGGADLKLNTQWSLGGEYLHADFGNFATVTSTNLSAFAPPILFPSNVFTHNVNLKTDTVRFNLNYRF